MQDLDNSQLSKNLKSLYVQLLHFMGLNSGKHGFVYNHQNAPVTQSYTIEPKIIMSFSAASRGNYL
jgi:hypothetical protein